MTKITRANDGTWWTITRNFDCAVWVYTGESAEVLDLLFMKGQGDD